MRSALAMTLFATGCLYVGDVNTAPRSPGLTITDTVDPTAPLLRGRTLHLGATMSDPEDGANLRPHWTVRYGDPAATIDELCDVQLVPSSSYAPGKPTASVTFFKTGTWFVSFYDEDHFQARSPEQTIMIAVVNAPPTFTDASNQISTTLRPTTCGTFIAGAALPLVLGTPNQSTPVADADADVFPTGCDASRYRQTLQLTWTLVSQPPDGHAVIGRSDADGKCVPAHLGLSDHWTPTATDFAYAACLYPDVGGTNTADMYQVAVFVTDGVSDPVRSDVYTAEVRADVPACLTGVSPAAGAYVVDRAEPQRFLATGAADDVDAFGGALTFVWSLWRQSDPEWREVPAYALPSYTLDASGFSVGEAVRVRVEVVDHTGQRALCDAEQATCSMDSCLLPVGQPCQRWATWDLELR